MTSPKSSGKQKRPKRPVVVRQIQGHSMLPVLPPGTVIAATTWFRKVKPGNIVIFVHNDKEKIKRVDKVEDGRIFVLGDHPETSTDSREFGWLPLGVVIAKVFWPHAPRHRAEGVDPDATGP